MRGRSRQAAPHEPHRANTAIVLDSTADFPDAPERFPNFRVVPLYVLFGDESYRDYVDMDPTSSTSGSQTATELPTTSQPTPGDFLAVYEELAPQYERILSLQISSTLSGTFASAQTAAEMLGGDKVRVIDTRTVSAAIALLAIGVQRRLERGHDRRGDRRVRRALPSQHQLLFTVNTLEYLAKGGRIGTAAALAGNLLNVKPILTIRDGEVVPLKRVRGKHKAFDEFRDAVRVDDSTDSPNLKVGIAHAAAPERLEALRELVRHERPHAADRDRRRRSAPSSGRTPARERSASSGSRTTGLEDRRPVRVLSSVPVATMTRMHAGFTGVVQLDWPRPRGVGAGRAARRAERRRRCRASARRSRSDCGRSASRRSATCCTHRPRRYESAADEVAIAQLWGDEARSRSRVEVVDARTRRLARAPVDRDGDGHATRAARSARRGSTSRGSPRS